MLMACHLYSIWRSLDVTRNAEPEYGNVSMAPPGRDGHAQARFGPAHGGLRAVAEPGRADPGVGGE